MLLISLPLIRLILIVVGIIIILVEVRVFLTHSLTYITDLIDSLLHCSVVIISSVQLAA